MASYKKWEPLEISWVDSAHGSGWRWEDETDWTDKGIKHKTIGYFRSQTRECITVVQSYGTDFGDNTTTDARMTIPLVAIKKINRIMSKKATNGKK